MLGSAAFSPTINTFSTVGINNYAGRTSDFGFLGEFPAQHMPCFVRLACGRGAVVCALLAALVVSVVFLGNSVMVNDSPVCSYNLPAEMVLWNRALSLAEFNSVIADMATRRADYSLDKLLLLCFLAVWPRAPT